MAPLRVSPFCGADEVHPIVAAPYLPEMAHGRLQLLVPGEPNPPDFGRLELPPRHPEFRDGAPGREVIVYAGLRHSRPPLPAGKRPEPRRPGSQERGLGARAPAALPL